jgi:hypothetical protein
MFPGHIHQANIKTHIEKHLSQEIRILQHSLRLILRKFLSSHVSLRPKTLVRQGVVQLGSENADHVSLGLSSMLSSESAAGCCPATSVGLDSGKIPNDGVCC